MPMSNQTASSLSTAIGQGPTNEIRDLILVVDAMPNFSDFSAAIAVDTIEASTSISIPSGAVLQGSSSTCSLSWGDITSVNNILIVGNGSFPIITGNASGGNQGLCLGAASRRISFYGATPSAKLTISGATGGNAAVQSIAAALATLGLLTNSTT